MAKWGVVSKRYILIALVGFICVTLGVACDGALDNSFKKKNGTGSNRGNTQLGNPTGETNVLDGWGGSIAYNEHDNNWLVVSQSNRGILARFVSADGQPAGTEIRLTPEWNSGQYGPKVAYAPDIQKFLVVWIGFEVGPIQYGQFLNRDGSFSGGRITIHNDNVSGGASFMYANSKLRYDKRNQRFVYVWELRTSDLQAALITIGNNGQVGNRVMITTAGSNGAPDVAVNEASNEYCVAWKKFNPIGGGWNIQINVKRVDASNFAVGAETTVYETGYSTTADIGNANIIFNTNENRFFVSWDNRTEWVQGVHSSGCSGSNGNVLYFNVPNAHSMAFNSATNTYLAIGQNPADQGNTYAVLDTNGFSLDSGLLYGDSAHGHYQPFAAPNTSAGNFAVITGHEYAFTEFVSWIGLHY